jgi:hypothetical protein
MKRVEARTDPTRWLACGAGVLWLASLFLPVIEAHQPQGMTSAGGAGLLAMGWIGLLAFQFGWLANPVLLLALYVLLRARPVSLRACLVLATLLALLLADALTWTDYPNDGGPGPITAYLAGYWTWIAAVAAGIAALLWRARAI